MRFRQKIFLITFIFVTISINLIGIIIINNNHKNLIENRIESNKDKLYSIEKILEFYSTDELNSNLFNTDDTYYEISRDNKIIYTNLPIDKNEIEELIKPTNNKIKAVVSKQILLISLKKDNYEIIIAEDIKDIFENRKEQIYFFIRVSMIFSFVIAFSLYVIIFILTRRIKKLDIVAKQVQKGDYAIRIEKLGKDEIGSLGESFNQMINSVDKNITEIKRVAENRKNFINDLTHEIRTPLTTIIGYSSLIKNGKIKDMKTITEYNNKIYEEGIYLNLISKKLTEIVLLDNKKLELVDTNIVQSITKAIDIIQNSFKDVIFVKNIDESISIKSDEVLLYSLLINILKNGVIACIDKEEKIIEISAKRNMKDNIEIVIKDNGKGMTEEQIKKVVEPFYTLNKDRNRKLSGMGLGLPLCTKICEVLNANFNIESKIGDGTIVTINFKI